MQHLNFKDGPTKTVNYIKETLNIDNLSFSSILSYGTLKDLAASAFNFACFESSQFLAAVSDYKDLVITLKDSAEGYYKQKFQDH